MTAAHQVVLVIDNDEDMRDVVRTALSHAGFETLGASSARQALSFLDELSPTAIVIDFLLADMDGVELAKAIRWRPPFGRTPMLMLTGAPDAARQQLFRAGLDLPVFAKPTPLDVVTRKLHELCGSPMLVRNHRLTSILAGLNRLSCFGW